MRRNEGNRSHKTAVESTQTTGTHLFELPSISNYGGRTDIMPGCLKYHEMLYGNLVLFLYTDSKSALKSPHE